MSQTPPDSEERYISIEDDPLLEELRASQERTRQRLHIEVEPEDEPGDSVPLGRNPRAEHRQLRRRIAQLMRPGWSRDLTGRMRGFVQRNGNQDTAAPQHGHEPSGQLAQAESSTAPAEPPSSSRTRRYRTHTPEPQEEEPIAEERVRRRQHHIGCRRIPTPSPSSLPSQRQASRHQSPAASSLGYSGSRTASSHDAGPNAQSSDGGRLRLTFSNASAGV